MYALVMLVREISCNPSAGSPFVLSGLTECMSISLTLQSSVSEEKSRASFFPDFKCRGTAKSALLWLDYTRKLVFS